MSNITLNSGAGGATLGTDQVAGTPNVDYQIVKIGYSAAGSAPTQVSTGNPLPVTAASLPLPTGASTAAKQPALGTAGTASTDVITVQGIASMTKLLVTPDSVALPANQSVNISQINAVTPLMGNGVTGTGSLRVTISSDNTAFTVNAAQSGTWTVQPGNTANSTPWLVTDTPATSGGLSFNYQIAPATPAKTAVKASAGQLYAIKAVNISATPVYVKLFNVASASVTLGTTNCDDQFPVPGNTAGAGIVMNVDKGISFGTAITAAITGGIASNDNTSITASSVVVTFYYK